MSNKKMQLIWIAIVVALLAAVVVGALNFHTYYDAKINQERSSQLDELVNQVGVNFVNSMDSNWDFVATAKSLSQRYTYKTQSDIAEMAGWLDEITEITENGGFFVLLDQMGRSYGADGNRGVWTDFDRVGTANQSTFIADSSSYDGYYWAFVQKLDKQIAVKDGSASVSYVVLLRTVASMESSFASSAYRAKGETYVLNENGIRMYDNLDQDDTLEAYNIYSALRETKSTFGNDFSVVEEQLKKTDTAGGDCVYHGKEYYYSLYHIGKYDMTILFWLPSDAIAINTVDMANAMIRILVVSAMLIALFAGTAIFIMTRAQGRARLLRQQEKVNLQLLESNRSLREAQKVAEQALGVAESANRAKSSFLSNMSHDIRTPLNAILGFQKLMDASIDDKEKIKEYSGKIAAAGEHLLSLINDILDMSRIESGKTTLNQEPFSLSAFIDELNLLIAPQAQEKGQTFFTTNEAPNLMILGDKVRLNQILMNILSNAVKYTQEGGKIEFLIEQLEAQNQGMAMIRFVVRDNGIGMDEEFQKRIFESFSREESALTSGISGTGLGMSITKNLVDLMGGIILVDSHRGKGSTFVVELSFRLTDKKAAEPVENVVEQKDILKGCHFLMAEDNSVNAEILTDLLELEGASCDVAHNGREAVELFTASAPGTYTAILMDVQMPVMDGCTAAREIRHSSHPEADSIPIAALTANAFAEDVQRTLEAGMNIHISKPVDMKKLREFMVSCKEPYMGQNRGKIGGGSDQDTTMTE